ncbi:aliphatic sulfonate ABC transporter substrate-binding protein [Promicromonospora kroppenstedtii]|uniref:aliphatic sulfonate ABC transporter substrate-binding protein n=1 Tax=Promicromonospora kroppenstedtii TaxID=440482 RepID=UPI0004BB57F4|nr:aliphatic sulfonate ABC transporter substrate-binding protein [Promicromonospora kroppenstedtii]
MRISRRTLGAAAAGLALVLSLGACSAEGGAAGEDATIEVDFGYIPDFNGTSLLAIAEDQGLWAEHGIDATASSFTNGPLQIQALGTGDLDFGYIGPGAFWLPASGQAKVVALNTLGRADRVVAQPGIDSVEDLRGRTVAVPEGTSGDMILTLALQEAGMTKEDVELVPMEPPAIVAALSSGQVDAAGFWYPALATVKKQVPDLVELARNTDFEETVAFPTAFVAGNDVVADDPEKVDAVLEVLREAIAYRAEHMDEAIALTAEFNDLPEADVEADAANVQVLDADEIDALTQDGTTDTWLTGMQDYFVGAGQLPEAVDPGEFYLGDQFVKAGE